MKYRIRLIYIVLLFCYFLLLTKLFFVLSKIFLKGAPNYKDPRISGGELATYGEFPFIASVVPNVNFVYFKLKIIDDGFFNHVKISTLSKDTFCTGFIYSPSWVVTAASCVFGYIVLPINVYLQLTITFLFLLEKDLT